TEPCQISHGVPFEGSIDQLHPDFAVPGPLGCANVSQTFVPGNRVFARNYA
ncbi:hypothetical protein JRQ81_001712, partial [Phrynocephalus forsythii]